MQRLTTFEHHVVRNVDNVVDAFVLRLPFFVIPVRRLKPLNQPLRAWTNLHTLNHSSGVLRTRIFAFNLNRSHVANAAFTGRQGRRRNRKLLVKQDPHFSRDADVAETIRTIAGHFKVDGSVVASRRDVFQVQPGHGELMSQFFKRHIGRDIFAKPVHTNDHGYEISSFIRSGEIVERGIVAKVGSTFGSANPVPSAKPGNRSIVAQNT